jgi:chemotaxis protein methyltransferase WspC
MSTPLDENLSEVFRLLRDRAGVEPESFGIQSIVHAVRKRVAASGAESPQDYLHRLSQDSGEFQELLEDLVVPETWFFRDTLAFRALARYLSVWSPHHHGMVRVLSVGCGTGEEVYSLAMALREAGIAPSRFRILGTDVSRRSLELAREGRFPARSFREPDEAIGSLCDRWCERVGESWRVRDELRAGV